jgi:HSP20 family molecular chaperone IbpA
MNTQSEITRQDESSKSTLALTPAVDIVEDEGGISLWIDLPGVPKDKLTVRMEAQSLLIEGEVSLDTPEGMEANYMEIRSPLYRRRFNLSRDLDPDRIEANYKHGVLSLRIPKSERAQPRKIAVNVA